MRIVAGEFKGRTLTSPTWDGLRPTSDRLRETLFNILGASVAGARVLDGYARAVRLIERNLAMIDAAGARGRAIIRACFADAAARLAGSPFDLIIVDPPYAHGAAEAALVAAGPLAGAATRVVVEHAKRYAAPAGAGALRLRRTVTAGDSALSFYDRAS
jgi:16S rRNA (guanine966-N2)-methyltransferase